MSSSERALEPHATLIHEVEAGYSPTCIAVIGARVDDRWFARLRAEVMASDAREGIEPHGPIVRTCWAPVTNDDDGKTIPKPAGEHVPVWWWDDCDEYAPGAVQVTYQEVRWT